MSVTYIASSKLPTAKGIFDMHGFEDSETGKEHVVLSMGDITTADPLLTRIHSECLTGDALFSLRCDCGAQLDFAMQKIAELGRGVIFYLRQEGRGIGLMNKIKAYQLQDDGADTVEANEALGFDADMREYSMLAPMVAHLGVRTVKLLTNNPRKIKAFEALGVHVVERVAHEYGRNPHNDMYLDTKKDKLGHLMKNKGEAQ